MVGVIIAIILAFSGLFISMYIVGKDKKTGKFF